MLKLAEDEDVCEKPRLIDLQNRIVDPRFKATDYRDSQNDVGETVAWQHERVHFVCPCPEEIHGRMDGLIESHHRLGESGASPIAHAASVAYGFVFLHPFEDGNGRIHRFLNHNILARRDFTPEGIMFPVLAAMLNNPVEYDASLEAYFRFILELVEYALDNEGRMTVMNNVAFRYRCIDMTAQNEALFRAALTLLRGPRRVSDTLRDLRDELPEANRRTLWLNDLAGPSIVGCVSAANRPTSREDRTGRASSPCSTRR